MAKLVLTEDDRSIARIYVKWLEGAGHAVTHVENGAAGMQAAVFGGLPDLLVTDIMMPETDGEELSGALDLIQADLPIVVVTALDDAARLARIGQMPNVSAVLRKPVSREDLLGAVAQALAAD